MSDFTTMVAQALTRTDDKDWAVAADLWARVTAADPVNGDYWARLGEARFGAQDYAGAREAYEKVLRLGVRETFLAGDAPPLMPGEVAYRIACCEAAAGDREAAVAALRAALDRGMRDLARVRSEEHWQELRADQRIRDMAGIIDTGSMSRDDGWRYDLAFLAREIKRLAYAPFARTRDQRDLRRRAHRVAAQLHRRVDRLRTAIQQGTGERRRPVLADLLAHRPPDLDRPGHLCAADVRGLPP
jgi:tetratricopeptide (TPR) repeat protein